MSQIKLLGCNLLAPALECQLRSVRVEFVLSAGDLELMCAYESLGGSIEMQILS